jgi:DNA polymerase III epsilon subunit-like protein
MGYRYYAGDVETTGVGKDDRVVEIAWIEIDDEFNVLDTVRSRINPERDIPAGASAVHGIVARDVQDSPTIEEFMDGFRFSNETGESCLIAHNAPFDARFFKPWMPNLAGTICTLKLARAFYKDADNHKLQTLKFHLGLEADVAHHEAHTAMADVRVLMELLKHLHLTSGMSLSEMMAYCDKPEVITAWPFGKHKGKPLNHDLQYVRWMLKQDNVDANLRRHLEAVL